MGKMTIVDDDGTTYTFDRFVAVGIGQEDQLMRMVEDQNLSSNLMLAVLLELAKLMAEVAQAIQPDREQES